MKIGYLDDEYDILKREMIINGEGNMTDYNSDSTVTWHSYKSEIKSVSDASRDVKISGLIGCFRLCLVFHFPNSPGGQGSTKGL